MSRFIKLAYKIIKSLWRNREFFISTDIAKIEIDLINERLCSVTTKDFNIIKEKVNDRI